MKSVKRKTRSDKFPLTLHPTGQYCKKIQGKVYYFGCDKKRALQKYLDKATYLHVSHSPPQMARISSMTLKPLCDQYLQYQHSKVLAGGLTPKYYNDQTDSLNKLMSFLARDRKIESISTLDLQEYQRKLQCAYGSVHRVNLHLSIMKAMFHWARKNDILRTIPNIDAISRSKTVNQEKFTFTSEQIRKLLLFADVRMKAMIWLGLNCGFGCTDCGSLQWKDIDFVTSRVTLARKKTGILRNLPLWPETVKALKDMPKSGPLVFYTLKGRPWIETLVKVQGNGTHRYTHVNRITSRFSRLLKKLKIVAPKGTGFYSLRRTAATIAARSGDPFAVQRLLGHADLTMATRYVQDVSEQTDRMIENNRGFILKGNI